MDSKCGSRPSDADTAVMFSIGYVGIRLNRGRIFLLEQRARHDDASVGSLFFFFQPLVEGRSVGCLLNETLHLNFLIGRLYRRRGHVVDACRAKTDPLPATERKEA